MARAADAVLFGAVGDPACDNLERHLRPEQAILGLRKRSACSPTCARRRCFPGWRTCPRCAPKSPAQIDLLIVRELNGDVYFGEKGIRTLDDGRRQGFDFMSYAEDEVRRIAHVGFQARAGRARASCAASTRPTCSKPASCGATW